MDKKTALLFIAGLLISIFLSFVSIYLAGIAFILTIALTMSVMIMKDSISLPDVVAELTDDAKGITIRNAGNAVARKIHVALVPENIEYDLESLQPDISTVHRVEKMIGEVKVVVTFENDRGEAFSRSYQLSSTGETYDPLKPMIPLFKWK
jgi:hypothetical protein